MTRVHFTGLLAMASTTDDPEVLAELQTAIQDGEVNFTEYIGETLDAAHELKFTIPAIDAEIARLEALKLERETRAKSLERQVQWYLEQVGQSEWHDNLRTVRIKRNPPKVVIESEALLAPDYWKRTIKESLSVDKEKIKATLQQGIPVDGAKLVTEYRMEVK